MTHSNEPRWTDDDRAWNARVDHAMIVPRVRAQGGPAFDHKQNSSAKRGTNSDNKPAPGADDAMCARQGQNLVVETATLRPSKRSDSSGYLMEMVRSLVAEIAPTPFQKRD